MCSSGSRNSNDRSTRPRAQRSQQGYLVVTHNYIDFADEPRPVDDERNTVDESLLASGNAPFPLKLYHMLESIHAEGDTSIVSWQPHGRCFIVHKPEEFRQLLPLYFKLSKIASFQRQLNLYGFVRLTKGPDRGAYYNMYFLRGRSFLLSRMTRVKVKGTGVRARSNPESEPDFCRMKPVGDDVVVVDDEPPTLVYYPEVTGSMPCASSASVVSEDPREDDDNNNKVPIQQQQPPLHHSRSFFSKDMEPLPLNGTGCTSLSFWGMPFTYMGGPSATIAEKQEHNMDDIVDDSYLEQTLQDILKETDTLFSDMMESIVSL